MYGYEDLGMHTLVLSTNHTTPFDATIKLGNGNLLQTVSISDANTQSVNIGVDISSPFIIREADLNIGIATEGFILEGAHPFTAVMRVDADDQAASLISKGLKKSAGYDFRISHAFNNNGYASDKCNTFSVMATEDNTIVSVSDINQGVVLEGMPSSGSPLTTSPFSIVLDAGESVAYAAVVENPQAINNLNGLIGTKVSSNKPVVVSAGSWLGGNSRFGTTTNGAVAPGIDIGIDQLYPNSELGTAYVLAKGEGLDNEKVIIVATQDNTQIYLAGSQTPTATLIAGQSYVMHHPMWGSNSGVMLTSNFPIHVMQMSNAGNGLIDDVERQFDINHLFPIECSGSRSLKIPEANYMGTCTINAIVDAGNDLYVNGSLAAGGQAIAGTSDYVLYKISDNYVGDVMLTSDGLIRAHLLNLEDHQGACSYFTGYTKDIKTTAVYSNDVGVDEHILPEGCGMVSITLERSPELMNELDTIKLITSGTGTELADYSNVPPYIVFQPGNLTQTFNIQIYNDMNSESDESVLIELDMDETPCGVEFVEFVIQNVEPIQANLVSESVICPDTDIDIEVQISGGIGPFNILWDDGDTNTVRTVHPIGQEQYFVTVTDLCGNVANNNITVGIDLYDLNILSQDSISVECPYTPVNLVTEVNGGTGGYEFEWFLNSNQVGSGQNSIVNPSQSANYTVTATDECGISVVDTTYVEVAVSLMSISQSPIDTVCPYDEVELFISVTGGQAPYSYNWGHSFENDSSSTVYPGYSNTYPVSVQDQCGTYSLEANPKVIVVKPKANFKVLSSTKMVGLPIEFQNLSAESVEWVWDFGNEQTSFEHSPGTTYQTSDFHTVQLVAINNLGCTDTAEQRIFIDPEFYFYAPNSFTPDGNHLNSTYDVSVIGAAQMRFEIFNRWGEIIYTTDDPNFQWDGTYNSELAPAGVYVYRCVVSDELSRKHEFTGHINLLR